MIFHFGGHRPAVCLGWLLLGLPLWATNYSLVDLGPGVAMDVNASGKVVGNAETGGWFHNGTTRSTVKFGAHYLGSPPDQVLFFTAMTANAINDNGRIVGSVMFIPLQPSTRTAYFYEGSGAATLLELGDAFDVNQGGAVSGGEEAGFIFNGTSVVTPAGPQPRLYAINDAGIAAGSVTPKGVDEAASFSGNSYAVLNLKSLSLGEPGAGRHFESRALSINNGGQIVGNIELKAGTAAPQREWAFLSANGTAVNLGSLGGESASARDINNSGVIVGRATVADGSSHAFVHANGVMSDLNALAVAAYGWVLRSANAVNDAGLIVGEGLKDGAQHAFLLQPATSSVAPAVNLQPNSASVFAGEGFTLAVTASGSAPLAYQWQHGTTNLPGATAATYTVSHASANDAGTYRVLVTNTAGSARSDDVVVTVTTKVNGKPEIALALYAGITINGPAGQNVQIEAVENASDTDWQPVGRITLDGNPMFWVDPGTPQHARRLYRAVPVP